MIRLRRLLTAAAVLALTGPAASAAEPSPEAERAAELARQLADGSFRRREAAAAELDRIGEPALPALKAASAGEEPEARRRAAGLVERIGRRVESARLMAPTTVELKLKDATVAEAVAVLVKQSGTPVELRADPAVARRKVTLDTGKVTFWEAVDRLCDEADLVELDPLDAGPAVGTAPAPPVGPGAAGLPPGPPLPGSYIPVNTGVPASGGAVLLAAGKDRRRPTSVFGAVRLQVGSQVATPLPAGYPGVMPVNPNGEYVVPLLVRPEAKVRWQGIRGVQVDVAVDEHGKSLTAPSQGPFASNHFAEDAIVRGGFGRRGIILHPGSAVMSDPFRVLLRVDKGDKPARKLAELRGRLVVSVQVPPEELAAVEGVVEAKGELVKGEQGVELRASNFRVVNAAAGQYELEADLKYSVADVQPAGPAQPAPGTAPANRFVGLALFDDKGGEYSFQYCPSQQVSQNGNLMTVKMKMVYARTAKGQSAPAKLAFLATHQATADVPFAFKDVTLP